MRLRPLAFTLLFTCCTRDVRTPAPPPPERCGAAAACEHGCDAAVADACYRLAELGLSGSGVPRDLARALTLYEKTCGLGDGRGCARRGLIVRAPAFAPDGGSEAWLDRAAPLLEQGCQASSEPEHCELWASVALELGRPAPQGSAARAVALYDARCANADAEACLHEGVLLEEGRLVPKESTRALARLLRACDLGLAGGCAAAGLKLLRGEGIAVDAARGKELMRRAKALSEPPDGGS